MSLWLGDEKAFIIMDQAGWHKSKELVVPDNISIIHLPPYSPELNPVERLWQHIKNALLKNRIYNTLKDLEGVVCDFICSMQHQTIKTVCRVNYMSYYL
jgi:transposase